MPLTAWEWWTIQGRILDDALQGLVVGPFVALGTGTALVWSIGTLEAALHWRPSSSVTTRLPTAWSYCYYYFCARYGVAQIIPSLTWSTQPVTRIAQLTHPSVPLQQLLLEHLYTNGEQSMPPKRALRITRLQALRGALAGSVVLSQVVALMGVGLTARQAYHQRCLLGQEPPLEQSSSFVSSSLLSSFFFVFFFCNKNNHTTHQQGMVIRMTGNESNVTEFSMARRLNNKHQNQRPTVFPIFEQATNTRVQHLVQTVTAQKGYPVPVYWQVDTGRYSHWKSWDKLHIPPSWFFVTNHEKQTTTTTTSPNTKSNSQSQATTMTTTTADRPGTPQRRLLLVLEADATANQQAALSLQRTTHVRDLDLDLYEVAQGFASLQQLAMQSTTTTSNTTHTLLRVVLVDTESKMTSGGGRVATIRQYISELDLADIVIDSRSPLVAEMLAWLLQQQQQQQSVTVTADDSSDTDSRDESRTCWWNPLDAWKRTMASMANKSGTRIPVILETPHAEWFLSIRRELAPYGYDVIDRQDALTRYGTHPRDLPCLVYEDSSADTIHTIRQLVAAGLATPTRTCALLTDYEGTQLAATHLPAGAASICSAYIHYVLFRWVRQNALQGRPWHEIQQDLDQGRALEQAKQNEEEENGIN